MPDQAAGLRSLFARRRPSLLIVAGSDPCRAAIAVHYAREAAASGRATLLIDGTAGQVAMACDVPSRYELAHVLAGDMPLSAALRTLAPHLLMLPAARALSRFGSLSAEEGARLAETFSQGIAAAFASAGADEPQVDLVIVNAAEGQAARTADAFGRDARVMIVASDRPASLRGAYAEMKSLSQNDLENFEIVSPRFDVDAPEGIAYANLATAARRFLDIELVDAGSVLLIPPDRSDPPTTTSHGPSSVAVVVDAQSSSSLSSLSSTVEVPHAAVVA